MAKRELDDFDLQAERESMALSKLSDFRPKNRILHRFYYVDGRQFPTGNRQRKIDTRH